jgi:tRNA (guanosine-2'-O-)-methyltransferase
MRRDLPEVFEINPADPLPAPPNVVSDALRPLLTDERLARIETVLSRRTRSVAVVLDGLIDPHNVSAVLRSADAFGVQEVHIIEAADPLVASTRIAKGAERWLDLIRHQSAEACIKALHARGFRAYIAEAAGDHHPADLRSAGPVAIIFGNEHAGVSSKLRRLADGTFAIPMRGFVESLNVSVAAAITLYAATEGKPGDLSDADKADLRARFMMLSVPRAREVVSELIGNGRNKPRG